MEQEGSLNGHSSEGTQILPVSGMYENWFLDYASYVILERAVPAVQDGFKPVQRRIMHAMKEMDDGRFNKVANIIGSTMQYHPHGDASIGDAIVNMGQKELLIETQGNWGDIRTGDGSAAPRYIEARLSKLALDIVFNPDTTNWQLSYDGRKKEPLTFPVKFPLLLAQGAEGIAVGLATKIMPHNFCELIKSSIDHLKGKNVNILPDFPTGGYADFSMYNEGQKGGKIRVRAKIEAGDSKTILIKEIPFSTTTSSLIDSIVKANDQGKIKIKKVIDNTAKHVEIEVQLAPGQSPDVTIAALYAFTDCESSISPNTCIIIDDRPCFISVNDILKINTDQTADLLRQELEIRKAELMEKLLFSSLEKIFIENRIYRKIEEAETWEQVLSLIDAGLTPFKKEFYREIVEEDLVKLTEIKIKRISKFDGFKADELMNKMLEELKEVNFNLENLIDYAIAYYQGLLKKYGKGKERKTDIAAFDTIAASKVAANNTKLYVNREEGFVGYSLKKDEFIADCSDLDDIIVFFKDGKYKVVKIADKLFVGKNILHIGVFDKNDDRMIYNAIYTDGKTGVTRAKRFPIGGVTRDREYDITKGAKGSKLHYFSVNSNGEAELVNVQLSQNANARIKRLEYDFAELEIKARSVQGNIVTKYPVRGIRMIKEGVSTLPAMEIWYDEAVGTLNKEGNGKTLGEFYQEDSILVIYQNGEYELTSSELTNRYDIKQILLIEKFQPEKIVTAIYFDGKTKNSYIKRFKVETSTMNKRFSFISDHKQSVLLMATTQSNPVAEIAIQKKGQKSLERNNFELNLLDDVKGWKSIGNKLTQEDTIKTVKITSPDDLAPMATKRTQASTPEKNDDDDSKEQLDLF